MGQFLCHMQFGSLGMISWDDGDMPRYAKASNLSGCFLQEMYAALKDNGIFQPFKKCISYEKMVMFQPAMLLFRGLPLASYFVAFWWTLWLDGDGLILMIYDQMGCVSMSFAVWNI